MSLLWSGPGRALQAHLDLFKQVDRAHTWLLANKGRSVATATIPATYAQRLKLMTAMADYPPDDDIVGPDAVDGDTVAVRRDNPDAVASQYNQMRGSSLLIQEHRMLNEGETHYVSHHITEAIWEAAAKADDEPLFPTDVPCPYGLIVLERPVNINDLHPETGKMIEGLTMPIRAIGWSMPDVRCADVSHKPGLHYALYTDREAYTTVYLAAVERLFGQKTRPWLDAERLDIWPVDSSGWAFGASWRAGGDIHTLGDVVHDNVAIIRRFLLTLWRFMWQRILTPETYTPTRAETKRALRLKPLEDGYVKVLRVRRVVEAERRGDPTNGDGYLLTAHIRRGHWHRTYFATLGPARNPDGSFNEDSHRLCWREPTVVGEGPITRGHNVTAVVR